ncbi:hypothetical protein M2322_004880 [Rhodoblastus acidophilus]|uniref:hypothetical protein n=1 Tax=Rhodoblastus acidophilus TaxID=1074 RepID=UPI0022246271|nr:hypothetical protein [Rhodoblastus acidophilus]MCW2319305.1 hypothetical protein [Rhodoblastus acidophilus]
MTTETFPDPISTWMLTMHLEIKRLSSIPDPDPEARLLVSVLRRALKSLTAAVIAAGPHAITDGGETATATAFVVAPTVMTAVRSTITTLETADPPPGRAIIENVLAAVHRELVDRDDPA